jgi:hypothetical protein
MTVTSGSPGFQNPLANEDAFTAQKLIDAGAVLIGKTATGVLKVHATRIISPTHLSRGLLIYLRPQLQLILRLSAWLKRNYHQEGTLPQIANC